MTLIDQAIALISDHRPYHSTYQIDNIIIGQNEFGDGSDESAYGAFLQIQREIQSRLSSISSQQIEMHKMQLSILEQKRKATRWFCWTKIAKIRRTMAECEVNRLCFELEQLQKATNDLLRELDVFVQRGEQVASRVRNWSSQKTEEVEQLWWARRFERRLLAASLHKFDSHKPAAEIVEVLADMPLTFRKRLSELSSHHHLSRTLQVIDELHTYGGYNGKQRYGLPDSSPSERSSAIEGAGVHRSLPRSALAYPSTCGNHQDHSSH